MAIKTPLNPEGRIRLTLIQRVADAQLLLMLCALNGRCFTRFQVKRDRRLVSLLRITPPQLAERIEAKLGAPHEQAFALLHGLEGEVLDLVAANLPDIDLGPARQRRAAFVPA